MQLVVKILFASKFCLCSDLLEWISKAYYKLVTNINNVLSEILNFGVANLLTCG